MPLKRWLIPTAALAVLAVTAAIAATNADAAVTPAAAPAPAGVTAADEIAYLQSLTGSHMLSGQQGGANNDPARWNRKAHDITGEYPGIWGGDFGFSQDDINNRPTVINEAKSEWAAGSLPALMMHACRPDVATCDFADGANPVQGSTMTDAEWTQLITDGSTLNTDYKRKLDQFVPYFQQLKDAGIPVLFRPQHEMNEGWAWWGGRPGPTGDARLYQITHDYLESKGLNNIIWVWALKDTAGGASQAASYYPGDAYVDVVALDVWVQKFPATDWYQAMQNIAGSSKPIALAEVGSVPSPAQMASEPKWAYWSVWMNWLTDPSYNTNDSVKAGYYDARVYSQGAIHIPTTPPTTGSGAGTITGIGGKCVDVDAANSANGTAVQLYTCNGTNAQQWTNDVSSDGSLRALGKCLDVASAGTTNGTAVQLYDCNGTNAQKWSYSSGRLISAGSGRCLDATGQSSADATRLQIWDCTGNANQSWTLPS
jgi:mannan endo-1,4-beta-mannosidase